MITPKFSDYSYAGRVVISVAKTPLALEGGIAKIAYFGNLFLSVAVTASGCTAPLAFTLDVEQQQTWYLQSNDQAVSEFLGRFAIVFCRMVPASPDERAFADVLRAIDQALRAAGVVVSGIGQLVSTARGMR